MGGEPRSKSRIKADNTARLKSRVWGADDGLAHLEGERLDLPGVEGVSIEAVVRWAGERGDGWLRIVPDKAGHTHWKWRFTQGRWAGHYVYWRQDQYEGATSAWTGLAGKLDLVDEGNLKPSKDVY